MSLKIGSTVLFFFFQLDTQFLIPKVKHKGKKKRLIALAYTVH